MSSKQTEAAALVAQDRLSNEKIANKVGISERTLDTWKKRPEFQAEVERLQAAAQKAAQASLIADKQYRLSVLEDLMRRYQRIIYERGKDPEMKGIPGGKTGLVLVRFRPIKTVEDLEPELPEKADPFKLTCGCGTLISRVNDGGHWETPNPPVCPSCGADNSESLKAALLRAKSDGLLRGLFGGKRRKSQVKLIREHMADTGLAAEIRALCEHIAIETGDWKQRHELTGPNGEPLVPKQPLPSCILEEIQRPQPAPEKKDPDQ